MKKAKKTAIWNLTKQDYETLDLCYGGADVYNYDIAKRCRKLEQFGLVKITKARCGPVNGAECQPYFGCIATGLGKQIAKRLLPMFKQ